MDWAVRGLATALGGILALHLCGLALAGGPEPTLDPSAHVLEPVVVTAQKLPVQRTIDRTVYDVSSDLQVTTGTAADILRELPSVEVDADGVVSLRGDSNVTILIDGKPSAQLSGAAAADALLQFSASDIERVEVITNPPAQFKANGSAGIINIITKKRRKIGASGTAQASAGNDGRYVLGLNGDFTGKQLNLAGGVGLRRDERQRLITDNRAAIAPGTNTLAISQEDLNEHVRRLTPSVKAQIDYRFNDRQSGGVTFNERERSGDRSFDQFDESGLPAAPTSISNRYSIGHEWRLDDVEGLHFEQKLRQPQATLSLDLQRSSVREREHYAYTNIHTLPVATASQDELRLNLDLVTTEFSADYALPLSNNRSLKLGYDFEQDNSAFDNFGDNVDALTGRAIVNPEITHNFHYLQQIHSAYASYLAPMRTWTFLVGLRLEETIVTFPQTAQSEDSTHSYARAYPNLRVERPVSDASTLWASVSRRVTRPDQEALNPFIDSQDTQNLRSGNPNLRPEDTQSLELGDKFASKNLNFGLTGYLRRNRNSVTDVTQVVSAQVVLITKANLPSDTSEGFEFTADGRLVPALSYALSANLFHDQIDATAMGAPGVKATTGINAKVSLDCHPTAHDTTQISFSRSVRRLTPQGYLSSINLVNVGYKHQFGARWAAILTVSDLFDGQVLHRFVGTPTLTDSYRREQSGRLAYIGVTYTFGAGKKNKTGFEYDQ